MGGGRFFPDFILWLVGDDMQHIVFVDPKGLNVGMGDIKADAKVQFCQRIQHYEEDLNERAGRDDVRLHAFIFSTTDFQTLRAKQMKFGTRADFYAEHVYFLEDGPPAVQSILGAGNSS